MKAMLKQDFIALAIEQIKAGRALDVKEQGAIVLVYADTETGAEHVVATLARPGEWVARMNARQRFSEWLASVTTSPEYGAKHSANIVLAHRARDNYYTAQVRRGVEKADNALNGIVNLLKDLEGFEGAVAHRGDLRRLREALNEARRQAENIKAKTI